MDTLQGTVLFLPAWNEAGNLPLAAGEAVAYLHGRQESFQVIIVDDGSTDDTLETFTLLELAYPGNVRQGRHECNRGYGAALRAGFQSGLQTGFGWICSCDADGQFKPHDVGKLLDSAIANSVDIAIGYRVL